jgi:hypothetical protein
VGAATDSAAVLSPAQQVPPSEKSNHPRLLDLCEIVHQP